MSYYGNLTPLADVREANVRGKMDVAEDGTILLQLWPGMKLDREMLRVHLADIPEFGAMTLDSAATTVYETAEGKFEDHHERYAEEQLRSLVAFLEKAVAGTL